MKARITALLLALLAAVLFLHPPQEKTVYVIMQTTESGEVRYIETERLPTEYEDKTEDDANAIIVIIVIVILVWLFGECGSESP